jgi:hypothetical protein
MNHHRCDKCHPECCVGNRSAILRCRERSSPCIEDYHFICEKNIDEEDAVNKITKMVSEYEEGQDERTSDALKLSSPLAYRGGR